MTQGSELKAIINKSVIYILITITICTIIFWLLPLVKVDIYHPEISKKTLSFEMSFFSVDTYIVIFSVIFQWAGLLLTVIIAACGFAYFVVNREGHAIFLAIGFLFKGIVHEYQQLAPHYFNQRPELTNLLESFSWFQNELFFALSISLAFLLSIIYNLFVIKRTKTIVLLHTLIITFLVFCFLFTKILFPILPSSFIYFSNLHRPLLIYPMLILIFVAFPLGIYLYKKHPNYFLLLTLIAIPISVIDEIYIMFNPSVDLTSSLSITNVFKILFLMLPLVGITVDLLKIHKDKEQLFHKYQLAMKAKKRFVNFVNREIKDATITTFGLSKSLLDGNSGDLNEKQKSDLIEINKAGIQLQQVLEDANVIEEEKISIIVRKESVKIQGFLHDINDIFANMSSDESFSYKPELLEDDIQIDTDPNRLKQAMIEIFQNAIDHTFEGTIVFRAFIENEMLKLLVYDHGQGISPNVIREIFDPKYEKKDITTIGFGLSICKKIAEALESKLIILKLEKGTACGIGIPLQPKVLLEKQKTK